MSVLKDILLIVDFEGIEIDTPIEQEIEWFGEGDIKELLSAIEEYKEWPGYLSFKTYRMSEVTIVAPIE